MGWGRILSTMAAMPFLSSTLLCAAEPGTAAAPAKPPLKVLILDGENKYHDWQATTPVLVELLKKSGRFVADVATFPPAEAAGDFRIAFDQYDAILSNYNSQRLPSEEMKQAFLDYLRGGGAFVAVHAANNSFAQWPEYNEVCGLGGWYDRDAKWGPYVYFKDGALVRDDKSEGPCGHHGEQHEYVVETRDAEHPIMQGMPKRWRHAKDELYDSLRGPAKEMTVLATAFSDPKFEGTNRDEPMLMVLKYGKGRVFHTVMGHADDSLRCVGFRTTLLRGTEWAATGEVTIAVPEDFPPAVE